ncbi:MAG TPA: TrkA family potassium uptake protein [Coriobacteriia bacterium]|nr:TrkA family potassium uptake protein [Coriobacteriia bacterium]
MRILIVGAGKTGAFLAEKLHADHHVTVIEQREDRVEYLRLMAPDVEVIRGDACEPDVLESAGVDNVDLVAAVTGDDEDNLVVAMLAKLYNAKAVYARVNHPRNEWLFDKEWGVDVPISSPQVLYGLIEKDLGFGDLITLLKLNAEGIYLEELTLPENATKVGKRLQDVGLPSNVNVMAILAAEGYVQAPRGETPLVAGDQLLMLVDGELEETVIREAFGIPQEPEYPEHPGR